MKIKKILSIFLSFVIVILTISPLSVLAAKEPVITDEEVGWYEDIDGYRYKYYRHGDFAYFVYDPTSGGKYTACVIGYYGTDTIITIPNEISGLPVVGIEGFDIYGRSYVIEEFIVPSNVVSISYFDCNAKKITFEENSKLKYIHDETFFSTPSLEEINLPKSVTYIGQSAFADCKSLRKITIPKDCEFSSRVFANCVSLEKIVFSGDTIHYDAEEGNFENTFPEGLVDGCTSLKTITIPKNCTTIPSGAFKGCTSLEKITFLGDKVNALLYEEFVATNGVKHSFHRIKENAIPPEFTSGCTSLTSITIPKNVKTIYKKAFKGCENLTSVKFTGAVNNIGRSAFSKCVNLKTVNFTKGYLKKVYDYAFYKCEKLDKITISNTKNVPSIHKSAFNKAKSGIKFYVKNNTVAKKLKAKLQKTNIKKAKIYRSAPILLYKNVG